MSEYDIENKGFDRILLFKPQKDMKYIRKLSMSYGYYVALAVVDTNERVTHVGVVNNFQIVLFRNLTSNDKDILGNNKCKYLKDDDLMSIYSIVNALKLKKPYHLTAPCRGMRYTTPEETYYLKKSIMNSSHHIYEENTITQDNNYDNIYSEDILLELDNISLDESLELELPSFDKLGAKGQTKLI